MTDLAIGTRLAAYDQLLASITGPTAGKPTESPKPTPASPQTPLAPATVAAAQAQSAALARQSRLDGCFAAASGPYTVALSSGESGTISAPAQFRMNGGHNDVKDPTKQDRGGAIRATLGMKVATKLKDEINRVVVGRGSPEDVRKVTQALIDAGALGSPSAEDAPQAIQAMQWKYRVGFDCAGYVQKAFFAARGMTGTPAERAKFGIAERAVDFDAGSLATNPKFRKVSPECAAPGDMVVLKPPPGDTVGHVVIVRSNVPLSALDKARTGLPDDRFPGKLQKIEVDSSWGAGESGTNGGVKRETWLYDPTTQAWATLDPKTGAAIASENGGPYDHPLLGVYRPKGEP